MRTMKILTVQSDLNLRQATTSEVRFPDVTAHINNTIIIIGYGKEMYQIPETYTPKV